MNMPACESKLAFLIKNCFECFIQRDCSQILLNPVIFTKDRQFRAANPIIEIDDNSLYRQAEMYILDDSAQVENLQRIAALHNLKYVKIN